MAQSFRFQIETTRTSLLMNVSSNESLEVQEICKQTGVDSFKYFFQSRVIVTGASKGIGKEIALLFLRLGARVALIARSKNLLLQITQSYPKQAFAYPCDLTEQEEINKTFKQIMIDFDGNLDILIHSCGNYQNQPLQKLTLKDWDSQMKLAVRSMFHLTSIAIPFLKKSDKYPSVICMTCERKNNPVKGELFLNVAYSMINTFIQCCALELAKHKIRVNGIALSAANTNFRYQNENTNVSMQQFEDFARNYYDKAPLKQSDFTLLVNPQNIAQMVAWLASKDASFITGQVINADDGFSLTSEMPEICVSDQSIY